MSVRLKATSRDAHGFTTERRLAWVSLLGVRGRSRPVQEAALLAAGLLLIGGCAGGTGAAPTTGRPVGSPTPIEMSTYTSEYGIRLGIEPSYPEDRVLTSPSVNVGDLEGSGGLWPMGGVDHEGEDLDPLSLPAGTPVSYEVTVKPSCHDFEKSPPIQFFLPARLPDGNEVGDTLVPSNPEAYEPAIRLWCKVGVAVQAGGGSLGDGDEPSRVALLIGNAGPDEIEVEVPALESGGASWEELSMTVPAGRQVTKIVLGWGVRCDSSQEVPWADGRLVINGKPWREPIADVWC